MDNSIRLLVLLFSFSLQSMDTIKKWCNHARTTSKEIKKEYQLSLDKTLRNGVREHQKTIIFELLIMLGANVNAQLWFSTTLEEAARFNNLRAMKVLLRNGANPNEGSHRPGYALSVAANYDNDKMIELLLRYGADINIHFPLRHTALRGVYHTVLTLLAQGAAIDDPAPLIQTIYQAPAVGGYEQRKKIVKALLYAGTNPYKKSDIEKCAPIECGHKQFKKYLQNHFTIAQFCSPEELADLNRMMELRSGALIKKACNTARKGPFFRQQQYRELTGRFPSLK